MGIHELDFYRISSAEIPAYQEHDQSGEDDTPSQSELLEILESADRLQYNGSEVPINRIDIAQHDVGFTVITLYGITLNEPYTREIRLQDRNGDYYSLEVYVVPYLIMDSYGNFITTEVALGTPDDLFGTYQVENGVLTPNNERYIARPLGDVIPRIPVHSQVVFEMQCARDASQMQSVITSLEESRDRTPQIPDYDDNYDRIEDYFKSSSDTARFISGLISGDTPTSPETVPVFIMATQVGINDQ